MPIGDVRIEERDGVVMAALRGEIDFSNARQISGELTAAVSNRALGVVADLSDTSYLDSSGVQLLFDLGERLAEHQQRLVIVAPPGSRVWRLLSAVGVDDLSPARDHAVRRVIDATGGV